MLDSTPTPTDKAAHAQDPHTPGSDRLAQLILGGQDGLVNVLGVLLGVAAATAERRIVLVAGLATAFAESVSMAAVAYTSTRATQHLYRSEEARERRHLVSAPSVERDEVRAIYARQGLSGDLLDRVVEAITSNPEVWVQVMMREEHGLVPTRAQGARSAAILVGFASLAGSMIPILPFFLFAGMPGMMSALVLDGVALFMMGWYEGRITLGSPFRQGLEICTIGLLSALAGWAVGFALGAPT